MVFVNIYNKCTYLLVLSMYLLLVVSTILKFFSQLRTKGPNIASFCWMYSFRVYFN